MKHAYLILAHHEFALLQTLIGCLDDARNDIYVHFDRKVPDLPELHAKRASLTVLADRVDVHWGDFSMVEAEIALFRTARHQGPYDYYHLLSGVDLPLKSQDYIHAFFQQNRGREFIGYTLTQINTEIVRKVERWHLFPRDFKNHSQFKRAMRAGWIRVQEIVGWRRNSKIDFKKGSQWVSVTEAMVDYLLDHQRWVRKVFRHTFCSDEMVLQTLCWHSPMRACLYNTSDDGAGCMRLIGWKDGELIDWSAADYDTLAGSPALFARKFNTSDPEFIQKVTVLSSN